MTKAKKKGKSVEDLRDTQTVTLPASKAEVELWESFTFGDYRKMENQEKDIDKTAKAIILLVEDWDLEKEGKKLPIKEKALDFLPMEDINYLSERIRSKVQEIAKKVKRS